jgi:hypothetical protein
MRRDKLEAYLSARAKLLETEDPSDDLLDEMDRLWYELDEVEHAFLDALGSAFRGEPSPIQIVSHKIVHGKDEKA